MNYLVPRVRKGVWLECLQAPLTVALQFGGVREGESSNIRHSAGAITSKRRRTMQVVYERCCGIDVHKRTVVACAIVPGPDGPATKETRTFATMSEDLEALAGWLAGLDVTHL